ncbi:hypothetical protein SCAR479_03445 [Seiridium cardinale]|uniref:Uncharacterized protein n=1 Tax=Seiridium cardinale TaxID=138064 RepID=A0ABR2Y1B1_9PEZI
MVKYRYQCPAGLSDEQCDIEPPEATRKGKKPKPSPKRVDMEDIELAFKWWDENLDDDAEGWGYLHSRIWENVIRQPPAFVIPAEEVLQATIDFLVVERELSSERVGAVKSRIQDFLAHTGNRDDVKSLHIPPIQLEFTSSQASPAGELADYESSEQSMNPNAIDYHTGAELANNNDESDINWGINF